MRAVVVNSRCRPLPSRSRTGHVSFVVGPCHRHRLTPSRPPRALANFHSFAKQLDKTTEVEILKADLEERGFNIKLTVIDTPGFGDYVNNRDSWTPIVDFIDDQHESYMRQEQQPLRTEKQDLRVHACLYFIRPSGTT